MNDERDEALTTTSLHEAQRMDQREFDAGSSIEVGQLGTDTSKDNGSHAEDDKEMTSVDQREVEQVESSRVEPRNPAGSKWKGGYLVFKSKAKRRLERAKTPMKLEESVDIRLMVNRSRTEGDRTEGKRDPPRNND
ncbi:hypothetical protein K435DRAFT_856981 [Dendrothele bispora CBS 962.96]|uniref:Uncharacterized protein n=1 Tax=Dendrothele bispora (strain CBS 962.96) TaxID=1314807 RepID=A0A4S8M886_DENBC|nr:hypothetical protein K435DRAFT_856981 [Dendrothele bispora CBS 962.96]